MVQPSNPPPPPLRHGHGSAIVLSPSPPCGVVDVENRRYVKKSDCSNGIRYSIEINFAAYHFV